MVVNRLPKTVTWHRLSCNLNPGPSAQDIGLSISVKSTWIIVVWSPRVVWFLALWPWPLSVIENIGPRLGMWYFWVMVSLTKTFRVRICFVCMHALYVCLLFLWLFCCNYWYNQLASRLTFCMFYAMLTFVHSLICWILMTLRHSSTFSFFLCCKPVMVTVCSNGWVFWLLLVQKTRVIETEYKT